MAIGLWKGMDRLAPLTEVEEAEFNEGTVSSLRPFVRWRRLRSLTVVGRKLKSLAGIEGLAAMEDLYLYNPSITDLSPLSAVPGPPPPAPRHADEGHGLRPHRTTRTRGVPDRLQGRRFGGPPPMADLASLRNLRELALIGVDGGGWRFLLDLPDLRRTHVLRLG